MQNDCVISGMGVISAIGQGKIDFTKALLEGKHAFAVMQRPGRQNESAFLGAEVCEAVHFGGVANQLLRTASLSTHLALVALQEAWDEARLFDISSERIGLIVGGSNIQQRELVLIHDAYRTRKAYLRPTYGLSFLDTDLCGFCTSQFGILGMAHTVGAASASGQMAIIQAAQAVASGQVDACVALGAMTDLSFWECQGLRALGAMGSDRFFDRPELACRPFDANADGFVYGESCGALVIERMESCLKRGLRPYAKLCGYGVAVDGNRNPDPSLDGEVRAIKLALRSAGWSPHEVDYINPHGTGSRLGDATEVKALGTCQLVEGYINATKSLIGHGLSAAGAVEAIATLLQMQVGKLHPTRNLMNPIEPSLKWVRQSSIQHQIENALTLSMGFGGINTALAWQRCRS